ncbi:hypothetical protein [Clostridioides difficile]|uniref:hypothetical protein n=1 Tax=Clostridioides difficile TaxID=1496 RepID=UPI00093CCC82|nr:hypothetical protein [Clostridioides difficile]EGT3787887.1 hypothetical protein [Clostridioides difficile]
MLNEDVVKKLKNVPSDTNNAIEIVKTELSNIIGDTTILETTDKTNIVSALNEVKTSVDSIETTAEKTSIKDTDNLFESDNVEGALKEVMQEVKGNRSSIISSINNNLIPM